MLHEQVPCGGSPVCANPPWCLKWTRRCGTAGFGVMGNELAKKYDMPKTHSASGGHECLWKIYQATAKATGEQVCVGHLTRDH